MSLEEIIQKESIIISKDMTEQMQRHIRVMRTEDSTLTYQDCVNTYLILKIAELLAITTKMAELNS